MRLAFLLYVIIFLMLKYGKIFNFIPHLKGLRNTDTYLNPTFHIASMTFIFTNQELKIRYQNRNHSYQTIFQSECCFVILCMIFVFTTNGEVFSFACFLQNSLYSTYDVKYCTAYNKNQALNAFVLKGQSFLLFQNICILYS